MMSSGTVALGIGEDTVDVGSHIMYTYDSRSENSVESAVFFARAGIAEGDTVVIVLPESQLADFVHSFPGSRELLKSLKLRLYTSEKIYFEQDRFSIHKAAGAWDSLRRETGTHQLRAFASGDFSRFDKPTTLKLLEYESFMNRCFCLKTAVCCYDTHYIEDDLIETAANAHPLVFENGHVKKNNNYLPPDPFFERFYTCESKEFKWPADPANCRNARAVVGEIAARMPFDLQEIDDIVIAVGEAFANAVRHGSPEGPVNTITLAVFPSDTHITIDITDEGCGISCEPFPVVWTEPGGKGLFLMRALCDSVEHFAHDMGCTVRLTKYTTRSRL